jgi:HEAT repeat protein
MLNDIVNFHKSFDGLNVRKRAYFILSKLLQKYPDPNPLQFLINQLHEESDKYVVSSLLDFISDLEKSDSMDIEPIIQLSRNNNWQIRHSAIRALNASKSPRAKQVVLEIIANGSNEVKKNQADIIYATSVLSAIGIIEDIAILTELSKVNIRDVRESAIFAIESINHRNGN